MFTCGALLSVLLWVLQRSLCTLNTGPLKIKKHRDKLHDNPYIYLKTDKKKTAAQTIIDK